ncbi:MAG: M28 family metallopeptidase [bacterium]
MIKSFLDRRLVPLVGALLFVVSLSHADSLGLDEKSSEEQIQKTVQDLVGLGDRSVGSQGNRAVATYLYKRLSECGLAVVFQGGELRNVVALLPGTNPVPREVLMVGAHYDSVKKSPGATDNGAGVAIVLEQARVLRDKQFPYDIKFAFWNAEETGGKGSKEYVKEALEKKEPLAFYLNYDSVGFDSGQCLLDLMYNTRSEKIAKQVPDLNTRYKLGYTLTHNTKKCFSDHRPFWEGGFCAMMIHCSDHGPAHTAKDTADHVAYSFARKNAQLGLILLTQWSTISKARGG